MSIPQNIKSRRIRASCPSKPWYKPLSDVHKFDLTFVTS